MTIRVRHQLTDLDARCIAAAITTAVLNPVDDASGKGYEKAGAAWLRWGDTVVQPGDDLRPRLD